MSEAADGVVIASPCVRDGRADARHEGSGKLNKASEGEDRAEENRPSASDVASATHELNAEGDIAVSVTEGGGQRF